MPKQRVPTAVITMELIYEIDKNGAMANVRFDGLDGRERVTSLEQALHILRIENPVMLFAKKAQAGLYDDIPDEEYMRMLDAVERVSQLWRYGDDPAGKTAKPEMNVLMLLANAIEIISRPSALPAEQQAKPEVKKQTFFQKLCSRTRKT